MIQLTSQRKRMMKKKIKKKSKKKAIRKKIERKQLMVFFIEYQNQYVKL